MKNEEQEVQTTPELEPQSDGGPDQSEPTENVPTIIMERSMPLALKNLIDASNKTLQETQQRLVDIITASADELMSMFGLNPADGWLVDLDGQRFVQLELPSEEDSE